MWKVVSLELLVEVCIVSCFFFLRGLSDVLFAFEMLGWFASFDVKGSLD